jgi:hypothetical protein
MWYVLTEIFKSPLMQTFALFISGVVGVRVVIAIVKKVKDSALIFVLFFGLSVGAVAQVDPLSPFYDDSPIIPQDVENVIGTWGNLNTSVVSEAKLSRLILNDIRQELAVLIGVFCAHILWRRVEA